MQRVTGIGGIFYKATDPDALRAWYAEHLGLDLQEWGGTELPGPVLWTVSGSDSESFAPGKSFTINFRVADLRGLLKALRTEGCEVSDDPEDSEYGTFGWVIDPDGNKLELWEPAAEQ